MLPTCSKIYICDEGRELIFSVEGGSENPNTEFSKYGPSSFVLS